MACTWVEPTSRLVQNIQQIGLFPFLKFIQIFQLNPTIWEAQMVKNLPTVRETLVQSLGQEDPLENGMVFPPGESHGWRSLLGYSPWGHKESGMSEQLTLQLYSWKFLINLSSTHLANSEASLQRWGQWMINKAFSLFLKIISILMEKTPKLHNEPKYRNFT